MKKNVSDYSEFQNAVLQNELVFLFGTGISSMLTGYAYSWWKWINDGIQKLEDSTLAQLLEDELNADNSSSNMIVVAGKLIRAAKVEGVYDSWMHDAFEKNRLTNSSAADTLKKLLLSQVVFTTTNYDLLLEKATGLKSASYDNPDVAFRMLDQRLNTHVLHIHGIYDSVHGIDSIIADDNQYESIIDNQGAQFIQNILGTRTLVFVGCGKTTDDPNISRFIEFAGKHLKMDQTYYYLCKDYVDGLPEQIVQIKYGDEFDDLPPFMEEIAQLRLIKKIQDNPLVDLTIYSSSGKSTKSLDYTDPSAEGLLRYHFAQRAIPFCGRKHELSLLLEFVHDDSKFSWWTITGQAGSGKSRLGMEFLFNLPAGWMGFFLNSGRVPLEAIESFKPFCNTLVIIDYVEGRERIVAESLCGLRNLFESYPYQLRVLLIERENCRLTGSWYSKLFQRINRKDVLLIRQAEYRKEFLNLKDMDRPDVESFISAVCIKYGDHDGLGPKMSATGELKEKYVSELYDSYALKFERLRFRPLYLQMFVEAWIDNDCTIPDYSSYTELIEYILSREQERWTNAVDGDTNVCNSFIRLMVRANISGKLDISNIPEFYKKDWDTVHRFITEHSIIGRQKQEYQDSLINSLCQNIDCAHAVIAPQFPDIIKEYMFSYYTDESFLSDMMKEIWQNAAASFSVFIAKCMMDFPEQIFFADAINAYKVSTNDYEVMQGRQKMLQNRKIQKGDDLQVYWDIIENEHKFWSSIDVGQNVEANVEKSSSKLVEERRCGSQNSHMNLNSSGEEASEASFNTRTPQENTDILALMKVSGLYLVAQQIGAWSIYDLTYMEDVIDEMLSVKGGCATDVIKKVFLQEHITSLQTSGFFEEAKSAQEKLESLLSGGSSELDSLLKMQNDNFSMMDTIFAGDMVKAKNILMQMDSRCDYSSLDAVQRLVHSAFNYDHFAFITRKNDLLGTGLVIARKCEILYPKDFIIVSRRISCEVELLNKDYFETLVKEDDIRKRIQSLEREMSEMSFNGSVSDDALELAWSAVKMLKINLATEDELRDIVNDAGIILSENSHLTSIASTKVAAVRAMHQKYLKTKISHEEVESHFKLLEVNPDSESLREEFFKMLEESVDSEKVENYLNTDIISEAVRDTMFNPISGSGVSTIDRWFEDFDRHNPVFADFGYPQPQVRKHQKVGRNEPCPCGSGKKFKKCCIGKGIFD